MFLSQGCAQPTVTLQATMAKGKKGGKKVKTIVHCDPLVLWGQDLLSAL